ncbi:MAG: PPC domain-containing protein [Hyphomonadaceae bacterium]|nr:PPC domain-containing protein [Hyphomonadaceae bacterium]
MRAAISFIALFLLAASATAQTPADQRLNGNLTSRAPRASFQLQLQAGQIVTLETSSRDNLDTVLTLNGPNGRQVAQNDDIAQGMLQSRIVFVAREAGRHTAVVSGYNNARGAFDLNISYGLDVGLSDQARTLREETLTFDARRTEHRYPVDLADGDIFVASTFALAANLDTTLELRGPDNAVLAQSDDRGDGTLNSQIIFEAPGAGSYTIIASTYGGNGAGDFILSLAVDPNAQAPFNFAAVEGAPIAEYDGELSDATPQREIQVNLRAGQTLYAVTDVTNGDLDTVLRLNAPDGYPVALNDDRGDGSLNSAFAYTAAAAGAYTLQIYRFAQSSSSGSYHLALLSVDASVVDRLQALADTQVELSGPEIVIETPDFRVLYTLEGRDASTPDYARAVADTLQNMLQAQTQMGWAPPVRDPDGRYRAYVGEANGFMGYTKPVQIMFDNPSTANARETAAARALLVIENDFRGMGKKAPAESLMRATVTHEFNHMVQFGYDQQEGLRWLYESTASWMETATVGRDQDATDYVADDFAAPERCWTTTERGFDYAQWTLLQSLADSYGQSIVVRLWENTVRYDGIETMSQTLSAVGTTIPDALQRWRVQNFARAYDLAPQFTRNVRLAGTITRNGVWRTRGHIQQLGANYVQVRMQGARTFTLQGDPNLELVGLGRRNGQIEVTPLGRGGVFDTNGYEYSALMVFNRAVPATPGACTDVSYSINVTPAAAAMPAVQYRVSAEHFASPTTN